MAESACLRRSFSHPSETSHELSQGDPICALGESISFGRYMSETLAWEKWSTFSHNRYLEEAEKSSRPGSVAKMKAYFEAHYRKIDAKKQAALEQEKNPSSYVEPEVKDSHTVELVSSSHVEPEVTDTHAAELVSSSYVEPEVKDTHTVELVSYASSSSPAPNPVAVLADSSIILRSSSSSALSPATALLNTHSTVDVFPSKDIPDVQPLLSVNVTSCDSSTQTKESQIEESNVVESSSNVDVKECPLDVLVYQNEDAAVNASVSQNSVEIKVNKCNDLLESDIVRITPEREVTNKKEAGNDKLEQKSKPKSEDSSLKSSKKSKISNLSSSLARLSTPVRPKKESISTISNVKSAKASFEKKDSTSKMVQMSINVNSDVKLVRKSSPVSHKSGIGKVFTPLGKMIRKSFVHSPAPAPAPAPTPTPSTSRASVNSVLRHPSATPQSETKRSRIALEKSFAKSRTALDQKLQSPSPSPSMGNMKSPITFSPFNFRTEERAAKRREFYERRLEKEAANLQLLEKAKVKSKTDFRKPSQSMNFSNAAINIRREVLSDKSKKIPLASPHPPKCESKPSTNFAQGKSSHPPVSRTASKPAPEHKKQIPVNLSTKKTTHENASPNIL